MKIAVLGGGHGCYAAAADLSDAGHEVRLWRRDAAALAPVQQHGIRMKDQKGTRDVRVALASGDIGAVLRGAELVLIPSPAIAQDDIARAMAPHLADGQVVYLPPGTFGSFTMDRIVRAAGNSSLSNSGCTATLLVSAGATMICRSRSSSVIGSRTSSELSNSLAPSHSASRGMNSLRSVSTR